MTERTHSFTGKSDFFDWCNMHYTPETIIEKATIFLGDAEIKKDKPEDLIPYYTHLQLEFPSQALTFRQRY